jgi:selenoprotein W-related protein
VSLTAELLKTFELQLDSLELIPSKGGVFEVSLNDELIFSKKALGRHAHPGEVREVLEGKITNEK